ncbi:MAG: hypothetical protein AB1349_02445 [Elusimicrobiota bacterium]
MEQQKFKRHSETRDLLRKLVNTYGLEKLGKIIEDDNSVLFTKDVYISLHSIVETTLANEDTLKAMRLARNIYDIPVFIVNSRRGIFRIRNKPSLEKAIETLKNFSNCFRLSPYSILNTFLAIVESQVTGFDLQKLYQTGIQHIESFIQHASKNNPNWVNQPLTNKKPVLIIPIGAAGSGKSTFYKELSKIENVINISCDNIRYLLFKEFGPCFAPWESCLSWWLVNQLTDSYINKGYSIFYNGVNTDIEYRTPMTMELTDTLYAGIPYNLKLVYFEPPVKLTDEELEKLKEIDLWTLPIDKVELHSLPPNVAKIIQLIKDNFQRTFNRTKEISEGKKEQNPFDVLYSVPAAIIKLFVEQSFNVPKGMNVLTIPRKEIKNKSERSLFYYKYAQSALESET